MFDFGSGHFVCGAGEGAGDGCGGTMVISVSGTCVDQHCCGVGRFSLGGGLYVV